MELTINGTKPQLDVPSRPPRSAMDLRSHRKAAPQAAAGASTCARDAVGRAHEHRCGDRQTRRASR
jgi:hypothetical protein